MKDAATKSSLKNGDFLCKGWNARDHIHVALNPLQWIQTMTPRLWEERGEEEDIWGQNVSKAVTNTESQDISLVIHTHDNAHSSSKWQSFSSSFHRD